MDNFVLVIIAVALAFAIGHHFGMERAIKIGRRVHQDFFVEVHDGLSEESRKEFANVVDQIRIRALQEYRRLFGREP